MTDHGLDRRSFLRWAGASFALAGLDGCTRLPAEHILPYVDNRPELTPGVAQRYATAMTLDGLATGLVVESHDGRPTKIEGNADHPASLGAAGVFEQASVLQLYDPDRARRPRIGASATSWGDLARSLSPQTLGQRVGRGERLRLLIEPTTSPLDEAMLARVLERYPNAGVHMYAPLVPDRAVTPLVRQYDLARADVVLAIDADVMASGPFHLRHASAFASRRRLARPTDPMNRLYVIESGFTSTGAAADHRFAVRPRDLPLLVHALAGAVGGAANSGANAPAWITAVARDLIANTGRALVVVGESAPPELHEVGDAINEAIGAPGRTTWRTRTPYIGDHIALRPFDELIGALRANAVDSLVIVGGNPAYAIPQALGLVPLLQRVPNVGYAGLYENETAQLASWFVPLSHYLESWGDARAYDGTLSIVQPVIRPLYESVTPAELYATLGGVPAGEGSYSLLRGAWGVGEEVWTASLQRGVVEGTTFSAIETPRVSANRPYENTQGQPGGIDVVFDADAKVHDGAFANNKWLQELPGPLSQQAWGNAAHISPATARTLGVATGDLLRLSAANRRLEIAALVLPGQADGTLSVCFGYGRDGAERVARNVGADAYRFWPALGTRYELGVMVERVGTNTPLAIVQTHDTLEVSNPVRRATIDQYRASPNTVGQRLGRVLSLYPDATPAATVKDTNQWAMTIDLTTCIGCGACTVACQAENNIPVVGVENVRKGRAMHWIRIDRYFVESPGGVDALVQPMLCQHCEKAPCEYVCPVQATVHSADGLNEMVYNRCVGTRFCSNNCPYKVRRFNWFDFNADLAETELMVKNPNVTVRERGVMEKCTFCVQRIREAQIAAGRDGREVVGSEIRTACQQACPTNAIVFGSLAERDSDMVRRREEPRAYSVLHELGTEPRVQYQARIRNPNPALGATGV